MSANNSLEIIRQKFLSKLNGFLPEFSDFSKNLLQARPSKENLENIRISVHQIAGSAKTFGFPKTSDVASKTEDYIDAFLDEVDQIQIEEALINKLHESFEALIAHSEQLIKDSSQDIRLEKASPHPNIPATPSKFTVLIGDDDTLVADLIQQNLESEDCTVIGVSNGREVVEKTKENQPDLIIQDVNMPEINGFDILKQLKNDEKTKDIPVIMLTKKTEDKSVIEGISSGAADYIMKPFEIDNLMARVLAVLTRHDTTIMIADDDELVRQLLSMRFRKLGFHVVTKKNGQDIVETINENIPNILLLDIMMPGIDGLAILREIKQRICPNLPVIMISEKRQVENIVSSFEEGAHDYITKPFEIDELVARVSAVLKRQQAS